MHQLKNSIRASFKLDSLILLLSWMDTLRYWILNHGFDFGLVLLILFLIGIGIKAKKSIIKQICFNSSAVFIALFIYETYLGFIIPHREYLGTYRTTHKVDKDSLLGYSQRGKTFDAIHGKKVNGELSYKVDYSFKNGYRIVPGNQDSLNKHIIFVGCSFTFGEGVGNKETLPYFLHQKIGHEFDIRNFALHGYGTHQVLATLEHDIPNHPELIGQNNLAYYPFLPDHIRRAAGYSPWDVHGPFYKIENDSLVNTGPFSASGQFNFTNPMLRKLEAIWEKSNIHTHHFKHKEYLPTPYDLKRIRMMLMKIDKDFEKIGYDFHVILDPFYCPENEYCQSIKKFLLDNGIGVLDTSGFFPEIHEKPEQFYIPLDGHPNANYNKKLADFIHQDILEKTNSSKDSLQTLNK